MRPRRKRLTDAELAGILGTKLSAAEGYDHDELDAQRRKALEYYFGRPRGDEVEGRSTLQSLDLADMVEAVLAQTAPSFGRVPAVQFTPRGEDDEEQARAETWFVTDAIFQQAESGFTEMVTGMKDALLCRLTVMEVWVDIEETEHRETLKNLSLEALELAVQPVSATEEVEVLEQEETGPGSGSYDVTLLRTFRTERLMVEAVPPENFRWQSQWRKPSLEGCPFTARRRYETRSALLERGWSMRLVEQLPTCSNPTTATSTARHGYGGGEDSGHQWASEEVEVWTCYIQLDMTGNGRLSLWRVQYAGNRVCEKEEVAFTPWATGVTIIAGHRVEGVSAFDKLQQIQDQKTHGLRQWADNLRFSNNPRHGLVDGQANVSDYITTGQQPGGYVRLKSADALVPIVTPDIGASAQQFLDYADKMRSERGGASLDLQKGGAQLAAGATAHGTEREYSAREQLAAYMLRTYCETLLRALYLLVHRTLRTGFKGRLELKREGEWQTTDPREWRERVRVEVGKGQSQGERRERFQALTLIVQLQERALGAGLNGVVTSYAKLYNALRDLGETAELDAPEQYWLDPESPEVRAELDRRQKLEAATQQAQQQREAAVIAQTYGLERYKVDAELRFKYLDALLDAEIEEAKLVGDATLQLEVEQLRMRLASAQQSARTAESDAAASGVQ